MAKFMVPAIQDNESGWGPCAIPEQFKDMPYQPFSKGDRMGKVSDWSGTTYQDRRYLGKYNSQFGGGSQYAYYHEEDEGSFRLVDSTRVPKPAYMKNRRFNQRMNQKNRERREQRWAAQNVPLSKPLKYKAQERIRIQKKLAKQFNNRQRWDQKPQNSNKRRDASVTVQSDWAVVEEMDFPRLVKLKFFEAKEPIDIMRCGSMEYYNKLYDRITARTEKRLERVNRMFHTVTTTDDPIIRQLAKQDEGVVFGTDVILATLMSCSRSFYSWDIIVQKVGSKIFFDKRNGSDFDHLTVNETALEPPNDDGDKINSPRNLSLEATYINHSFSQQCLKQDGEKYQFENKNPFLTEDDQVQIASVGYRYRKWNLGDGITLIARCEHDCVAYGPSGELVFGNIKTLNEWDSKASGNDEWRQKIDLQRGAILATEIKNNSARLAKWTIQALLAGSDFIKFGYVSRIHSRDSSRHVILGTQQFNPKEFAVQINLRMENAWAILRCIIDYCQKLKDGKYLLLKDPNKPVVRLYDIPDEAFESDDDDDEDDEDEEEAE